MGLSLLEGNEAIGWGALDAGCRFFAGYPITPATSVFNTMLRLLPPVGGIVLQGEDEIASMGYCIGASMAKDKKDKGKDKRIRTCFLPQSNRRQHAHSMAYTVQEGTFRDVINNTVTVSGKVVRNSLDGFAVTKEICKQECRLSSRIRQFIQQKRPEDVVHHG